MNKMRLTDEDIVDVFEEHELNGFGIDCHFVIRTKTGEYYVVFKEGIVCADDWR